MRVQNFLTWFIVLAFALCFLSPSLTVQASSSEPVPMRDATAYDMIIAMNTLRASYGYPALIEDPIVNAVAQYTAETMAASQMSWHIGDVRGRLAASGYGGGATVWATENFAVGNMGIDEIMSVWADPDHMRPAATAAYCHVGAGVATASNGMKYYILQAAYIAGQSCGDASSSSSGGSSSSGSGSSAGSVSQLIVPVKIATPDEDGKVYHVVQAGQSFWSIAISYQIKIADLETWNNLTRDTPLRTGQRLFIPGKNTVGYSTPTPVGMIALSTPDVDGRVVHEVQPYQALISISTAYNVSMERILTLNGLQKDWPLQIGQKLLISPGNITPSPTLSAIQKLTPASDGNYYHIVQSGETLSWIASLYDVPLESLMAWNGLNSSSILRINQELLLMVTPPATQTLTPAPPTITSTLRSTLTPTVGAPAPLSTSPASSGFGPGGWGIGLIIFVIVILIGALAWLWFVARKK